MKMAKIVVFVLAGVLILNGAVMFPLSARSTINLLIINPSNNFLYNKIYHSLYFLILIVSVTGSVLMLYLKESGRVLVRTSMALYALWYLIGYFFVPSLIKHGLWRVYYSLGFAFLYITLLDLPKIKALFKR